MSIPVPPPTVADYVDSLSKVLAEVFEPAGVLLYVSSRHGYLNGLSIADAIRYGRIDLLATASRRLNQLADGTIL